MMNISKGQKEKSDFFNGLVSYRIGIVVSVSVLYRIVKNLKVHIPSTGLILVIQTFYHFSLSVLYE